jgi:hypothetical protein
VKRDDHRRRDGDAVDLYPRIITIIQRMYLLKCHQRVRRQQACRVRRMPHC